MKIAIGSDCHDNFNNLEKVIRIANDNGCEYFLYAGDFVSPLGLSYLKIFKGNVEMVWGNNEGEKVGFVNKLSEIKNATMHGDTCEIEIDGLKFFMEHKPVAPELAAKSGDYDVAIHGHTHIFRQEQVNNTLLVNPGNIGGFMQEAGFVIFDTKSKEIERIKIVQ